MDMTYNMRNAMVSSRNMEEPQYDMSTIDLTQNSMNTNYLMNGSVLTNAYNNDYIVNNRDKYTGDMISQLKIDQGIPTYSHTLPMNGTTLADTNDSLNIQGMMRTNMDTTGFDGYSHIMNYNNTQNTIQTNPITYRMEDYNNLNNDVMYINPTTGEKFSAEYVNNIPTNDSDNMLYSNNFKNNSINMNALLNSHYNNLPYPMPIYESMNNPQMYMPHMNQKQTVNIPLQHGEKKSAARNISTVNKRRIKTKKFFPCC
ncbi:conserved Plasmodium protein, unknown function [Plasmodium sp. gorilla clade G1]|nr:conserved Plasmodium protein, unknown function [Plasmodium sp. gorilla clade G1]